MLGCHIRPNAQFATFFRGDGGTCVGLADLGGDGGSRLHGGAESPARTLRDRRHGHVDHSRRRSRRQRHVSHHHNNIVYYLW